MKIALSFPGCHNRGGVERVVLECARYLASRDHDVTVFANEFAPDMPEGVTRRQVQVRQRLSFLRGASYQRQASRDIESGDFDVVNTHGCVCPLDGVHRVHSVHRAWLEYSKAYRSPLSAGRIKQRLNPLHAVLLRMEAEHFADRRYRKLIALTQSVKNDLARFYDVPGDDVVVVPNGFNPAEFNPERRRREREVRRAELGLSSEQRVLLFVANELDRKGYPVLLDAMRRLNDKRLALLVVGRCDMEAALRAAGAAGLGEQVKYCGSTNDVGAFHAASDLFVLPTQYEAFCLAILEALGSGLPVITTNVPGASDAIKPNANGLLVEDPRSGEELARAIGSYCGRDDLDALAEPISASVCCYRWPAVMAQYEEVLQGCV